VRGLSRVQRIAATIGPAGVVLVFGLIASAAVRETMAATDQLGRAHRVTILLERVVGRSTDAETAGRGFALTGDDAYLEPYRGVPETVRAALDSARAAALDPAQQQRLAALGPLVDRRLAVVDRHIALRRSGDLRALDAAIRAGAGKTAMDTLRAAASEIQRVQAEVIERRQHELRRRAGRLHVVLGGGTLVAVALAFLTNLLLSRHARAQERLVAELEERNELLQEHSLELELQAEELQAQAAQLEETAAELEMANDELVRAQAEGHRQHELLRIITDNAASALVMMDGGGAITFWNPAAESITAYPADRALGRTLHALVHHTHPDGTPFPASECPIDRAVHTGVEVPAYEDFLIRADGVFLPVFCAAHPIVDAGRHAGTVVELRDVTDQKRTEEALRRAKEDAEAANRAKMEFLSTMSHELRTPLNAIGGYVDLMDLGVHGPITDLQRVSLGRIRKNQDHLLSLINDILHFARVEAGRLEYEIEEVSIGELLRDLEPLIEPQVKAAEIQYDCVETDALPAARGDRERIQQILLNLVTNALKFTPAGGRIGVSCDSDDRSVAISVSDTGTGIPVEMFQKIFDPFFQLRSEQSRDSSRRGVGLGLAISRDLARAMGGDLTVRSTPGAGSTFTLRLPVSPLERESPRSGSPVGTAEG
jgi:PAS domain S-box-containing protein